MTMQSIPASEILKACEGMLRKQLYVVFTKPTKGMEPVMVAIEEHLNFQIDLERRGIMSRFRVCRLRGRPGMTAVPPSPRPMT